MELKKKTKSIFDVEEEDKDKIKLVSEKDKYKFDRKKDLVGEGFSGRVYRAKNSKNQIVALKVFDSDNDFDQEVSCYLALQGLSQNCKKYIVCMIDYFTTDDENYEYVLVMDYLENYFNFEDLLKPNSGLTLKQYDQIIESLVEAVKEMNDEGVYHNDIHAGNIMVTLNPVQMKLIDMGNCFLSGGVQLEQDREAIAKLQSSVEKTLKLLSLNK